MYWPTDDTQFLLVIGLLPVVYSIVRVLRAGFGGLLDLEPVGVVFLWIGYQLSPWLAFLSPLPWRDFLLVPEQIDRSLLFSTLCMLGLIVGGHLHRRRRGPTVLVAAFQPPAPSATWLLVLGLMSLILFVVCAGGIGEVWESSRSRGEGQFDARDLTGKLMQMLQIVTNTLNLVLMTIASVHAASARVATWRFIRGVTTILIASLPFMWVFSRGAGVGFLILALTVLNARRRSGVLVAIAALLFGVYLGRTGLGARSNYRPGLGPFLAAATSRDVIVSEPQRSILPEPKENGLDATGAFTRKIDHVPPGFSMTTAAIFVWNLAPLPSELTPKRQLGQDLSEMMGTVGSVGITTPALADVYYAFGLAGCMFFVLLGALYSWFTTLYRRTPSTLTYVTLFLCFLSFPMGLHGGVRTMTRPIVYALVVYFGVRSLLRTEKNPVSTPSRS